MVERTKSEIREKIWNKLEEKGVARFPRPVNGRIPNFKGADIASEKLEEISEFKEAEKIKVNPDSPQNPVRSKVIEEGKTLFMPTPRLKQGFLRIRQEDVPSGKERKATTIKHSNKFGESIGLEELPEIDLVVAGSVGVNKKGGRIGKGGGYTDLEYAILRELDLGKPPVITTVHSLQIVDELPRKKHDVSIDWIVTPEKTIETNTNLEKPSGIDWELLSEKDLKQIPILRELKNETGNNSSISNY